jgi:lipoprotein-anchoring transpeptidase ErfK/SrfK
MNMREETAMKSASATISRQTTKSMVATLILAVALPCFAQSSPKASAQERMRRVVLVSIADRRLAVIENGNVLAYFPVAVGAGVSPSPTGEFEIVSRVANPTYYHQGVVMAAGKDNPVGTRWMGLNLKGYGIHGTNAPRSIGHATSHGCIRLSNRDVERLYAMLRVGDIVEIRGERDEEIASVFGGQPDGIMRQVAASNVGQ